MRGATHARWAVCATAVALAATACGGGGDGGDGGGGGDGSGILSSSWGDPQNPLEPANTNEVQGGKVLDMLFRGLKRYDAKTGEAKDMLAEKIDTSDSQNFTVTVKDG
jgi:oligopeptide transport system substrate-binding protein